MVSMVYPGDMLSTLPMMPKLREPAVELCHMFAAMKWLKGEITIAATDLSNRTMGPE